MDIMAEILTVPEVAEYLKVIPKQDVPNGAEGRNTVHQDRKKHQDQEGRSSEVD